MTNDQKFSALQYLSITLLVAPLVLVALAAAVFMLRLQVPAPGFLSLPGNGESYLLIATAAGVVCILCEWLVLPFVIPREHPRPAYTPFISFTVGLILAAPLFLLLRDLF